MAALIKRCQSNCWPDTMGRRCPGKCLCTTKLMQCCGGAFLQGLQCGALSPLTAAPLCPSLLCFHGLATRAPFWLMHMDVEKPCLGHAGYTRAPLREVQVERNEPWACSSVCRRRSFQAHSAEISSAFLISPSFGRAAKKYLVAACGSKKKILLARCASLHFPLICTGQR